jgi:hypothetical protein
MAYQPNLKLIRDNDPKKYIKWKKQHDLKNDDSPYAMQFFNKNYSLVYVATNHTNKLNSPTYELIKKVLTEYKKTNCLVVLEGQLNKKGLSPDIKHFNDELNIKNEINYAYFLCKRFGMPYCGVEEENHVFEQLSEKYSPLDIFVWECLRVYPHYNNESNFRNIVDKYVKANISEIFHVNTNTLDFDNRFEKIFKKKFSFGKTKKDLFFPNPNKKDLTNKIGVSYNKIRNIHNIKNLYKYLGKYKNVIFIYGQNHLYCDYDVLYDTFQTSALLYQY